MPKPITAVHLPTLLRPGLRVFAPGISGQSGTIAAALRNGADAASGVTFVGVWLPGINRVDYAGLHPQARAEAFFLSADLHDSFASGRIEFRPLSYSAIYRYLEDGPAFDLALLQVSAPGTDGCVSLGVANDFTPAVLSRVKVCVAHVNALMPRTNGAATIPWKRLDHVLEEPTPLLTDNIGGDAVWAAIGEHIATLVPDGATLEVGIGQVQQVITALAGHRRLRFHTGAIMSPLMALEAAGALATDDASIVTGAALGNEALYEFAADGRRVRFAPVGWTHDTAVMRVIERFVAINAVIEIDLLGQANAEMVDGRQVSSAGGITDFMRGAALSRGGKSIIAMPATARGGQVSRIVARLPTGCAVSIPRAEIDFVVTEFGAVQLRDLAIDQRAEALMSIAAPAFQSELKEQWVDIRRRM